jgi:mRNA-degrading endonuclease toxin of MazEF toxin-antitoxin module
MMSNVSRPLIALLVGTVAFFALWMVALKPSSSSSSSTSAGLGAAQSAINKAHQAVATANAASAAQGGTATTTPATSTVHAGATQVTTSPGSKAVTHSSTTVTKISPGTPQQRLNAVERALVQHKTIALLFYNPAGSDDRAVKVELAAISTHGGKVVKLAVPLNELTKYSVVTNQVPVVSSPTLVLIDRHARAGMLVGFSDQFEIAQRVSDTLAIK